MVATELWFALGAVAMVLGTAALGVGRRRVLADRRRHDWILVAVPGIAAVAYALMAAGVGGLDTVAGVVYVPRYADWLLTMPLHLLFLGLLVGAPRAVLGRAVGLQALTVGLGFAAAFAGGALAAGLFLASAAAFAGVLYTVLRDFQAAARQSDDGTMAVYRKLRAFVLVLWVIYPVIWVFAPGGSGVMDGETTTLVVAYLDIVAKIGFGVIALHGQAALQAVEPGDAVAAPAGAADA